MLSHSHFNTGVQTHDSHAGASHVPVIRQQCHVEQREALEQGVYHMYILF